MSGDLEDFLRRAAQRRQAKAAQEKQAQSTPRQKPQYSDRRTERVVRSAQPDEILEAEIVEEDDNNSIAGRMRRVEEAKRAAAKVKAEIAQKQKKVSGRMTGSGVGVGLTGYPARDLIALLKQPGGIQQAILLREVFDRPEHRW